MKTAKKAELILENGMRFEGKTFGHVHDVVGEVIFTTGMVGYQEEITDPAFCGQILVKTYPLIGNYGINFEDMESDKPAITALVVREKCDYPSNFRNEMTLDGFMKQNKIVGIEGIDTRALTRIIRDNGSMKGIITTKCEKVDDAVAKKRMEALDNSDVVSRVSTQKMYKIDGKGEHVVIIDLGVKKSVINSFTERDCAVTVVPYNATPTEIKELNPDMIFVAGGPGDPRDIPNVIETVKVLVGDYKISGICLGHLVIAMALGCKIEKLSFGHHGGNHPVKNLETGSVSTTVQNHNFYVSENSDDVVNTHVSANDGTCQGLRHKKFPIASIQFHPEGMPCPVGDEDIFDVFLNLGGANNA